jgi:ATPase
MNEIYVPDISTIVNGRITQLINQGDLEESRILVPVVISMELETRAELGRDSGFSGLDELKKLRELEAERVIELSFVGNRPSEAANPDEVRSIVREIAKEHSATLITSDEVMAEVAEIEGLKVRYLKPLHEDLTPELFKFFEPEAMSVHLKTGVKPMAKVGRPGSFKIKVLGDEPLDESEMRDITREITELARRDPDGYVEIEKKGANSS